MTYRNRKKDAITLIQNTVFALLGTLSIMLPLLLLA